MIHTPPPAAIDTLTFASDTPLWNNTPKNPTRLLLWYNLLFLLPPFQLSYPTVNKKTTPFQTSTSMIYCYILAGYIANLGGSIHILLSENSVRITLEKPNPIFLFSFAVPVD